MELKNQNKQYGKHASIKRRQAAAGFNAQNEMGGHYRCLNSLAGINVIPTG